MGFSEALKYGKIAESYIAKFFLNKGYAVLPIYEKQINEGKGPQLFIGSESIIGTDMLIFNKDKVFWIEAKHKTAFSWHRKTQRWVTGIDLKHYEHYQRIQNLTSWPVWLLFYHEGGQAKDSPAESPAGLFGNELKILTQTENHRHMNWGNSGMVYWAISALKLLEPKPPTPCPPYPSSRTQEHLQTPRTLIAQRLCSGSKQANTRT